MLSVPHCSSGQRERERERESERESEIREFILNNHESVTFVSSPDPTTHNIQLPDYSSHLCQSNFTAPCYSNGAVLPLYDVCPSVRLYVTLVSADHIR